MLSSPPAAGVVTAPVSALETGHSGEPTPDLAFRSTLTRETEFVLLSARSHLQGARRGRWEKLLTGQGKGAPQNAPALDWKVVLQLAQWHRILGLLSRHLSARGWRDVPLPIKAELQNYLLTATLRTQALKAELARASHHLETAGVPVVSFKGPTLGLTAYGNPVMRPSSDLDLLVARSDVMRARALLMDAGYVPEIALSSNQSEISLRVDSVINLYKPAPAHLQHVLRRGYAVELHWAITSPCLPFDLDYATVASRLEWIDLPGVTAQQACVRALSPEDLLLILCVHGAKHLWERLIWLCDLAELIAATPALDWERVLRAARQRGVQRMTALGLALMHSVLGAPLPREVEVWISTQPEALRLASRLRPRLLAPASAETDAQGKRHVITTHFLLMQTIDSSLHRLGFLWHFVTAPTMGERATLDLPGQLDFLWCVLRPARALQKRFSAPSNPQNPQNA